MQRKNAQSEKSVIDRHGEGGFFGQGIAELKAFEQSCRQDLIHPVVGGELFVSNIEPCHTDDKVVVGLDLSPVKTAKKPLTGCWSLMGEDPMPDLPGHG